MMVVYTRHFFRTVPYRTGPSRNIALVLMGTRSDEISVDIGNSIVLQLWQQEAGATYILQTEQTHTAITSNAPSYVFTASPSMTVSSGDVFGCYVPTLSSLRMETVTNMPEHTIFTARTGARPTEFTAGNALVCLCHVFVHIV